MPRMRKVGRLSSFAASLFLLKGQCSAQTVTRGGIQERTVGLRFLGIISRVLRLEVSTLVFCLSTRCYS
jgi:hypothetical protein